MAETSPATTGARVKTARIAAGMTQADLADAVGLSRASIANIERSRQELTVTVLLKLAAAVGVSVGQLVGETPMPVGIFRPHLADLLADAIESAGDTQVAVARKAGISAKHLNQMTLGKVWAAPEIVDRVLAACGRRITVGTVASTED